MSFFFFCEKLVGVRCQSFPYIVPVIAYPFPKELLKGKHFILADLLKSIPSGSS